MEENKKDLLRRCIISMVVLIILTVSLSLLRLLTYLSGDVIAFLLLLIVIVYYFLMDWVIGAVCIINDGVKKYRFFIKIYIIILSVILFVVFSKLLQLV
jgi:hypothetical protein